MTGRAGSREACRPSVYFENQSTKIKALGRTGDASELLGSDTNVGREYEYDNVTNVTKLIHSTIRSCEGVERAAQHCTAVVPFHLHAYACNRLMGCSSRRHASGTMILHKQFISSLSLMAKQQQGISDARRRYTIQVRSVINLAGRDRSPNHPKQK